MSRHRVPQHAELVANYNVPAAKASQWRDKSAWMQITRTWAFACEERASIVRSAASEPRRRQVLDA
jgi:hypothetical protein